MFENKSIFNSRQGFAHESYPIENFLKKKLVEIPGIPRIHLNTAVIS